MQNAASPTDTNITTLATDDDDDDSLQNIPWALAGIIITAVAVVAIIFVVFVSVCYCCKYCGDASEKKLMQDKSGEFTVVLFYLSLSPFNINSPLVTHTWYKYLAKQDGHSFSKHTTGPPIL